MIQKLAWAYGIVFLAIGILGFVPGITSNGMLLGLFMVDGMHNVIHLLSGIAAIVAVMGSGAYVRLYFQVFGVVYGLVAILGLVGGGSVLGFIMVNMADSLLHVVIAGVALWAGFGMKDDAIQMPMGSGMGQAM